jgi:hypothetical protein
MTYDVLGPRALDYLPCRYGTSKLIFRGPRRNLEGPYLTFVGGTQTFGKFIEQPYPLKVEHLTGLPSVNFGQNNAGPDVFSKEVTVQEVARKARATVLEAPGAANMTNMLYAVHPRRNDRFLRASGQLRTLYPDVDFTRFNFTQHMLQHLRHTDADRFCVVTRVLQRTWLRKMKQLLTRLGSAVILLRIGTRDQRQDWGNSIAPALVTGEMFEALAPSAAALVHVIGVAEPAGRYPDGMSFSLTEEEAARTVSGPQTHTAIARTLLPILDRIM